MSVVIREKETNKILLLCKGADSFVDKLLRDTDDNKNRLADTVQWLEKYAETGLRTLLLAKKEIPENIYTEWR
jgi:magnesium-transporting ATPase (P-type)